MAQDSEQNMKNMVENLIGSLQQKGIKVESAAVLKISGDNEKEVDAAVKNFMEQTNRKGYPTPNSGTEKVRADKPTEKPNPNCWCPNCFRFDNFEERLSPLGGSFDYVTVSLLGKQFDIKFHRDAKGRENLMVMEKQFEVDPQWNAEQIQGLLNQAVQNKDFAVAQKLLNQLNNLKNQ